MAIYIIVISLNTFRQKLEDNAIQNFKRQLIQLTVAQVL